MSRNLKIIALGASAGGLKPILEIFDHLPADTGLVFVIIQHLSPNYNSLMPDILAKHTAMDIEKIAENTKLKPNTIYLNSAGNNVHYENGYLKLVSPQNNQKNHRLIDFFFSSIAKSLGECAVGIILSGTGSDGSNGLREISENNGIVIAQNPDTAEFDAMPQSAISTQLVDFIGNPGEIARILLDISKQDLPQNNWDGANRPDHFEDDFDQILQIVSSQSGVDFYAYKNATLERRLEKRLAISGAKDLKSYTQILRDDKSEVEKLHADFLIGVTSFYRDDKPFEILKNEVIPSLISKSEELGNSTIRIWVPGCSTGEEVYSLAILFAEVLAGEESDVDFKIFATDIKQSSINTASEGIYSEQNIEALPHELRAKYFRFVKNQKFSVIKPLRERVVFSQHDLLNDPPFINLDFISCRNILIYFKKPNQDQIIDRFQYALNESGVLLIGSSESLGVSSTHFQVINKKWRLYRKKGEKRKKNPFKTNVKSNKSDLKGIISDAIHMNSRNMENVNETRLRNYLNQKFSPPVLIINDDFELLYLSGNIADKLHFEEGVFERNILKMVPREMVSSIEYGIHEVKSKKEDIKIENVTFQKEGKGISLDLVFHAPESDPENGMYLIYVDEEKEVDVSTLKQTDISQTNFNETRIRELEVELKDTREQLQTAVEELESSNEEFQTSNEELMASNEELQSTNEELQTVNEELNTVNSEVQEMNRTLSLLNDDMENLLNSIDVGTVFLDRELTIRKFTSPLRELFALNESDVGRSIRDFSSKLIVDDRIKIEKTAKKVYETDKTVELEVENQKGQVYLMRTSPYLSADGEKAGVVISFVDVSPLKKKEKDLLELSKELEKAQQLAKIGSWSLNIATNEVHWTEELYNIYGFDSSLPPPPYTEHAKLFKESSWKKLSNAVDNLVSNGESYVLELELIRKDGTTGWLWAQGVAEKDENGNVVRARGIAQDISETKELNLALQLEKQFSEQLSESSPNGVYIYDYSLQTDTYINTQYQAILGYTLEDIQGMSSDEFFELFHPDERALVAEHMNQLKSGKSGLHVEYRFKHKKGHWVWCYSVDSPFEIADDGTVKSVIGVFIDISEKKKFESDLKEALIQANSANVLKSQFLANMSHEIRTPLNWLVGFANLLKDENLDVETRNEYIDYIEGATSQLLNLINDIIDVSKIEAGEIKINKKPFSLKQLLKETEANFNETIKAKEKEDLKLKVSIPTDSHDLMLISDVLRVKQVVNNLIGNAVKFSEDGTIEFGYEIKGDWIEFFVRDQGIGIPSEKLEIIFERFEHLETDSKKYEGTGLGLSISKGLAELLGGMMEVESQENNGSTFRFKIPLDIQSRETKSVNTDSTIPTELDDNVVVLIAEDEPASLYYMDTILKRENIKTYTATTGEDAIEQYKKHPEIDVVLMDIRMPVMDGDVAAKKILEINPDAKIIAQTAFAMADDQRKYLDMGFVSYLAKPIKIDDLMKEVSLWAKKAKKSKA